MISHRDHRDRGGGKGKIFRKGFPFVCSVNSVRNSPSSSVSPPSVPSAFSLQHPAFSHGFSLIEVSLALLIVGVAMLSILGMFPAGLEQNSRSINDTHAALFAGEVFSSLRVYAEANWDMIGGNSMGTTTGIQASAQAKWNDPDALKTWLDDMVYTNIYCRSDATNIVDHALRYRGTIITNGLIKAVTLRVWPDEFGTTSNPSMFYSEFYKMNR